MKLVSIVGDSISTYAGYNPEGYKVYYDNEMQKKFFLNSVYDTWWAKVNQALEGYLCVNNSYSGSCVSGTKFPAAFSNERLANLRTDVYEPDIILIYIGFNDFGNGVRIKRKGVKLLMRKDMAVFKDAYEYMLFKIRQEYPMSKVVCGTLMRTEIRNQEKWMFPEVYNGVSLEDYNTMIRRICKKQRCYLADVVSLGLKYETLDGVHPTITGHAQIASAWITCLKSLGFVTKSI